MTVHSTPTLTAASRRDGTLRLVATRDGSPLAVDEVLGAWAAGGAWYGEELAAVEMPAFHWEHLPWTPAALGRPYECVTIDSPALAREVPDPADFAAPLAAADGSVATFPNLGHDARLVVPTEQTHRSAYRDLASFVRDAPAEQRADLWRANAEAVRERLGARPLWLSTAGLGVPWLHVRLDDRPKYVRHGPYRRAPA